MPAALAGDGGRGGHRCVLRCGIAQIFAARVRRWRSPAGRRSNVTERVDEIDGGGRGSGRLLTPAVEL